MRQEGYYWVKYHKMWLVAFFDSENIYYPFYMDGRRYMEKDFDEIGDRIPMPDEVCEWRKITGGYYDTACRAEVHIMQYQLSNETITFCPHCGRMIKIVE